MTKKKNKGSNKRRDVRIKIYNYYSGLCHICNNPVDFINMTLDHIVPKAKGGSNKQENLAPSHYVCNQKKADQIINDHIENT